MDAVLIAVILILSIIAWVNYYGSTRSNPWLSPALMDLPTLWRNPQLRIQVLLPSFLGLLCLVALIIYWYIDPAS